MQEIGCSAKKNALPKEECARELLWTLSSEGNVTALPPAGDITGWTPSECLGKSLRALIHPLDVARMESCYPDLLMGRTTDLRGFRCLQRDGTHRFLDVSFVPRLQNGFVGEIFVLGCSSSKEPPAPAVSASVLAFTPNEKGPEMASGFAGMSKLLESLLAHAPVGFALLDEELRIVCVNQAFSAMTGFSPEQHLGMNFERLVPEAGAVLGPSLRSILASGGSLLEHEVMVRKAPIRDLSRFALMNFYPIPDGEGHPCGIAAIAVDITDRKRADKKLREKSLELTRSNEALEVFCHTVSHDLNEPLRTIASYVKLLARKYHGTTDPEAEDYVQFAVQGTQHMRYLIDGLLDYARAGHAEFTFAKVDCTEVVQTVLGDLKAVIEETGSTICFESLPTMSANRLLLLQVFQNLIANGIKFRSDAPCRINISVERMLHQNVFSVSDNGIGIKAKFLPTIFAPFKKLHAQSVYPGAGLGLAISQKNIERLGGRIWVTSEEKKGTTFSFSLPLEVEDRRSVGSA